MQSIDAPKIYSERADRWAMFISFLCLLHCLFTPLFLLLFPALNAYEEGLHFHEYTFIVLLSVAAFAFYKGYKLHKKPQVLVVAGAGFGVLISGLIYHEHTFVITSIGSALLIGAHLWNMKYCHCACCEDHSKLESQEA